MIEVARAEFLRGCLTFCPSFLLVYREKLPGVVHCKVRASWNHHFGGVSFQPHHQNPDLATALLGSRWHFPACQPQNHKFTSSPARMNKTHKNSQSQSSFPFHLLRSLGLQLSTVAYSRKVDQPTNDGNEIHIQELG